MYRGKRIGLVIPARNEEKLIRPTLEQVPDYVDSVYVVDDDSQDEVCQVVAEWATKDPRVQLLQNKQGQGPGGAIITGYLKASADDQEIVVVCGGDNQMPLEEMPNLLDPLVENKADYAKGNRFLLSKIEDTYEKMPKMRLVANWLTTGLAKMASGLLQNHGCRGRLHSDKQESHRYRQLEPSMEEIWLSHGLLDPVERVWVRYQRGPEDSRLSSRRTAVPD